MSEGRTVFWRATGEQGFPAGLERCSLFATEYGWMMAGRALLIAEQEACEVRYRVACDHEWRTVGIDLGVVNARGVAGFHLLVDEESRWWRNDRELPELAGCLEVDLGFTPATNTLPIRRLAPPLGSEVQIEVALVQFPDLTIVRAPQRYLRLGANRYRFSSDNGGFTALIEVDDLGLVETYGEAWERLAQTPHHRGWAELA